jgi:hypothetical protein
MAYTLAPFNPSTPYQNQVATELNTANTNFTILGQAFYNNDPSSNPVLRASYVGSSAPSNPVAGTTWLDTSSNPPMLKVYDGNSWRLMAPLNSSGVLDLSNAYVKSNVYTFRRVDLSNASSDYLLQVGEEAYISFSNASSVALHIATQSGTYYEMHLICSNTGGTSGGSTNPAYLNPNNTTYSNGFLYMEQVVNRSGGSSNKATYSAFRVGWGFPNATIFITNYTQYKNVRGFYDINGTSNEFPTIDIFSTDWQDTSTAWTSLGTVSFPQSSSGYILVRRLV